MKKIWMIGCILGWFCLTTAQAQDLVRLEWFVGNDPGIGRANTVAIDTAKPDVQLTFNVPLQSLPVGLHTLGMRILDANGRWSQTNFTNFYRLSPPPGNIVAMEYFVGADPGLGAATKVQISSGSNIEATFTVPLNSLPVGLHTLGIRTQNASGRWSQTHFTNFYRLSPPQGNIVAMEYFIGADPGMGAATKVPISSGSNIEETFTVPLNSLPVGLHTLGVRTQNASGRWSMTHFTNFYRLQAAAEIAKFVYTIDDPKFEAANVRTILLDTARFDVQDELVTIDLAGVSEGQHVLYLKAVDVRGVESMRNPQTFTVINYPPIALTVTKNNDVACFGGSTGSITITASGGSPNSGSFQYRLAANAAFQDFTSPLTLSNLAAGAYTVEVRQANIADYSETRPVSITQPASALTASIPNSGVQRPACPSDANGSLTVSASGGTQPYQYKLGSGSFQASASFSALSAGAYTVTVKDANGCEQTATHNLTAVGQAPPKPQVQVKQGTAGVSAIFVLTTEAAASYQWYRNGLPIANATARDYEVQPGDFSAGTSTSFTVEVALSGSACKSLSDPFVLTELPEDPRTANLLLYPNPVSGILQIEGLPKGEVTELLVKDLNGRNIQRIHVGQHDKVCLDMGGYASGLYLLELSGPTLQVVRKVSVLH